MHVSAQLACPECRWESYCGASDMLRWLKSAGMVRRDTAPEPELLPELFRAAAAKFACPKCGRLGLVAADAGEDDDEAWGMARQCVECGQPIPKERLDARPQAIRCVNDERRWEAGSREA